jgi:hypothetical protein
MACTTQLAMNILDDTLFVIETLPKTDMKHARKRESDEESEMAAMAQAFRGSQPAPRVTVQIAA